MRKKLLHFTLVFTLMLSLVSTAASANTQATYYGDGYTITKSKITGEYDWVSSFQEGFAAAGIYDEAYTGTGMFGKPGKYGFIDENGELVIPLRYSYAKSFQEGFADIGGFYIDKSGAEVFAYYEQTAGFSEGLARVKMNGKWGYIDQTGEIVIACEYTSAHDFHEGLASVYNGDKWGFIDKSGKVIIPFEYFPAMNFNDGLAPVSNGDKYGVIDKTGKLIIPYTYNMIADFSDGLAQVTVRTDTGNGYQLAYGFINTTGTVVIPIGQYASAGNFSQGLAFVSNGNKCGYIDTAGTLVLPLEYDYGYYSENLFCLEKNGKFGVVDRSGNNVVPFEYDFIPRFNGGLTVARQGSDWYILKINGNVPTTATPIAGAPSTWATEQVNAAIAAGIVPEALQSKYTAATTRAEFCALAVALYETATGKEITGRSTFSDTTDVNVQKMASLGVVAGVGDNKFSPDTSLTREQAAAMLSRLASVMNKPMPEQAPTFADNGNIGSWAYDAVGHVQAAGIMSGVGDNQFSPSTAYTREQSIVTMLRMFDYVK